MSFSNHLKSAVRNRWSFLHSKIYNETQRESRILYTFRGEKDLVWWDMMTDENIGGFSKCKMRVSDNGESGGIPRIYEFKFYFLNISIDTRQWNIDISNNILLSNSNLKYCIIHIVYCIISIFIMYYINKLKHSNISSLERYVVKRCTNPLY